MTKRPALYTLLGLIGLTLLCISACAPSTSNETLPTQMVLPRQPTANPAAENPIAPTLVQPTVIPPTAEVVSAMQPPVVVAATALPVTAIPRGAAPLVIQPPAPQVANTVVLNFAAGVSADQRQAYIQQIGGSIVSEVSSLNSVVVSLPSAQSLNLPASPLVVQSEPDYYAIALQSGAPQDPLYDQQWALPAMSVPLNWQFVPANAPTVVVAVIDSGICANHPDLVGRSLPGWDFVENDATPQDQFGHGCGISGIIAANRDTQGIVGIAPNVQILPLRVLDGQGVGTYSNIAAAVVYAVDHGATILNLSLGGSNPSTLLENAITYAVSNNVLVIAAAGNNATEGVLYPAAYPPVVAVGSVDSNRLPSAFSNYGSQIDIWAPGNDIITIGLNNTYTSYSGTSFSAPQVAGVAALEQALGRFLSVNGGIVNVGGAYVALASNATPQPTAVGPTATPILNGDSLSLSGWLNVIQGDPLPGSTDPARRLVLLTNGQGSTVATLQISDDQAETYNGQQVVVSGQAVAPQAQSAGGSPTLNVATISLVGSAAQGVDARAALTGTYSWANVLCRFADVSTTPHTVSWYSPLFSSSYPGLDHYWQQTSYNAINLAGTTTVIQWYTLPQLRAYYVTGGTVNLAAIAQDCASAADAELNFLDFSGVNLLFNDVLDGNAWGGSISLTLDGQTRSYLSTWTPPAGQTLSVLAREMGHAFGLANSTGPANNPPSGNVYVSQWDVMSAGGTCVTSDPNYGCLPVGTIGYNLDTANWLSASRKVTVNAGSSQLITLEQLHLPQNIASPVLVKIPIAGSSTRFYTVEVRTASGYDQNVPGQAVIIHDVDTTRSATTGQAYVVDTDGNTDVNDPGAMWTVGEMFSDSANAISVRVVSADASSYTIAINNTVSPTLSAPADASVTNNASPLFTWGALAGAGTYRLQIANDTAFTSNLRDIDALTAAAYTPLTPLTDGVYYWRISADGGPWSAVGSFTVDTLLLEVPNQIAPGDGESTSNAQPIFEWTAVSGAVSYDIQLDIATPPSITHSVASTSYTPASTLAVGRTYAWRVRAVGATGNLSAWSPIYILSIASPPSAVLSRNYYSIATPALGWTRISWATGYEIQVDNDSVFASPEYTSSVGADTRSVTTTALANGMYYWRVRAKRADGTFGPWSAVDTFTVALP